MLSWRYVLRRGDDGSAGSVCSGLVSWAWKRCCQYARRGESGAISTVVQRLASANKSIFRFSDPVGGFFLRSRGLAMTYASCAPRAITCPLASRKHLQRKIVSPLPEIFPCMLSTGSINVTLLIVFSFLLLKPMVVI